MSVASDGCCVCDPPPLPVDYRYRKDELFKRMKPTTFAQLVRNALFVLCGSASDLLWGSLVHRCPGSASDPLWGS